MSGRVAEAGRVMTGTAIVLVVLALLFILIGSINQNGFAIFGAIVLGLGVLIGLVGYVTAMSRR